MVYVWIFRIAFVLSIDYDFRVLQQAARARLVDLLPLKHRPTTRLPVLLQDACRALKSFDIAKRGFVFSLSS
jgi:hypothetical protein